eukprot:gene5983-5276_t
MGLKDSPVWMEQAAMSRQDIGGMGAALPPATAATSVIMEEEEPGETGEMELLSKGGEFAKALYKTGKAKGAGIVSTGRDGVSGIDLGKAGGTVYKAGKAKATAIVSSGKDGLSAGMDIGKSGGSVYNRALVKKSNNESGRIGKAGLGSALLKGADIAKKVYVLVYADGPTRVLLQMVGTRLSDVENLLRVQLGTEGGRHHIADPSTSLARQGSMPGMPGMAGSILPPPDGGESTNPSDGMPPLPRTRSGTSAALSIMSLNERRNVVPRSRYGTSAALSIMSFNECRNVNLQHEDSFSGDHLVLDMSLGGDLKVHVKEAMSLPGNIKTSNTYARQASLIGPKGKFKLPHYRSQKQAADGKKEKKKSCRRAEATSVTRSRVLVTFMWIRSGKAPVGL